MYHGEGTDDYIHREDAVQTVIENGWLTEGDIALEILGMNEKAFKKLKKLLEKKGIEIRKIPQNPTFRSE